jgi:hypothetical protein
MHWLWDSLVDMEVVALAGLVSLGYAVSRLAGPPTKKQEGFQGGGEPNGYGMTFKPNSQTVALKSSPRSALAQTPQGASAVAPAPELDLFYHTPNGQTYPSEPSPGPYGMPVGYATQQPPLAPSSRANHEGFSPEPMSLPDSTPQVRMNSAGIEENPTYVDGNVFSSMSGNTISSSEFKHNNMVPYFGGRVKQNMRDTANTSILDSFTGAGTTNIKKTEVESMFDYKRPFGNPFGLESATDFVESRMETSRRRNNERPFEPTQVGPGIGEPHGLTGKGGFQQFEVNQVMRPRTTDELRTANNPKLTYDAPVVPGARFITNGAENPGEVRKYRPDGFFIDETNSRAGAAAPVGIIKEASRPIQILPDTTRAETSTEAFGPASGQDTYQSYVSGSYKTPQNQNYGGAGYRNANMNEYYTFNTDQDQADYGKSGFENRPNERTATSERTMGLNLVPAETGQASVRFQDDAKPTRREELECNGREYGSAVGYANGAPAATVWDPSDVARTTVKETTVNWNYKGIVGSGSQPNKLKVYDPLDIARPTQKSQLSNRQYYGSGNAHTKGEMNNDFAYNMRTNPNKEVVAKGRKPIAGAGEKAVFNGVINQNAKRLVVDDVNDRANSINRVVGLTPGQGDIGQVKYRVPLRLDVSAERLTPDIVAAANNNPLQQSLQKNAQLDAERLMAQRSAGATVF